MPRVDTAVDVFIFWLRGTAVGVGLPRALDLKVEYNGVVICSFHPFKPSFGNGFHEPFQPFQSFNGTFQRDEAEAMGKDFVCDDGGVVLNVNLFDGQGGNFGEEDATESVGYRGVDTDERENCIMFIVLMELDLEVLFEFGERPRIVFTRMMAGEVGGCDVGYGFSIDANDLSTS